MNTVAKTFTRIGLAVSAVVLATGCGTGATGTDARPAAQDRPTVAADAVYDGWAVRASWYSPPWSCPWSPVQVERMMESGQPLPVCLRRLQRWFREHYDPDWNPSGPTAGRW